MQLRRNRSEYMTGQSTHSRNEEIMQEQLSITLPAKQIEPFRVALVCMPFASAKIPSVQIGLLTAIAEQAGFAVDAYHLNLDLAARLTSEFYEPLCDHRGHMTGEWLFSVAAFGEDAHSDDMAYFSTFSDEVGWVEKQGKDKNYLSLLRHEILPRYIEDCLNMVDWQNYQAVGFSSTFQQNVACLALARKIKEQYPTVKIIFGGANMEDEMGPEYARAFPFIDYVVVGEGDIVFPMLLRYLAAKQQPGEIPGLVMRSEGGIKYCSQALPVRNLDALPTPNYKEFFARSKNLGLEPLDVVRFESSRGCWWGQKHHCTFCGLNGLGMSYRVKSPKRVLAELSELMGKYRINFFAATDNILDMKYVKDIFAAVLETKTDYQFFYEVKANLTHEQLRTLYQGGIRSIQPGIESLSSHVLQLMRKGCTMLQNVRLLKWCRYYTIDVGWNLIWGFPGETEEDYRQQLAVLKLITHLQPPRGSGRIWLERFAPYFFDREAFPIHDLQPEASYRYVYPAHVALDKIAYFFDYQMEDTVAADAHKETLEWVKKWQESWNANSIGTLVYRRTLDEIYIDDKRTPGKLIPYTFDGPLALIYEYCSDTMRSVPQVMEALRDSTADHVFTESEVQGALEVFCEAGLMLAEEGRYLSLALPVNPNW